MDKYVFRNLEDAPAYQVEGDSSGIGTFWNVTLFGDEPKMPMGDVPRHPEQNHNFHSVHRTTLPRCE